MFKDFKLKIKLEDGGIMPKRANPTDAGLDFFSPNNYNIPIGGDILIPLQIRTDFNDGYALIIKEKSGVAVKRKLSVGACVIDSSYTGIIHAHLFNHSNNEVHIERGDKIVQGIIIPVWLGNPILIDNIDKITSRGTGGFGSTGERL